jgi:hypothetical protein
LRYTLLREAASRVAAALLLVNLAAIFVATFGLGKLLEQQGRSARGAWLFALFPGAALSIAYDLNEPVAYAFAICGLLALDWRNRLHIVVSALLFGAAALGRETTLLLPLVLATEYAWRTRRLPWPFAFGCCVLAPYAAWRVLVAHLGGAQPQWLAAFPLDGMASERHFRALTWLTIAAPLLLLALGLALKLSRSRRLGVFDVFLGVELLLSLFLARPSFDEYISASRLQIGVLLAALLARPAPGPGLRVWKVAAVPAFAPVLVLLIVGLASVRLL